MRAPDCMNDDTKDDLKEESVPRRTVDVIPAGEDVLPAIAGLWQESRVDAGASPDLAARTVHDGRLTDALSRPGVHVFLARLDGALVGFVVASENVFGLSPTPEVAVEQLFVHPGARRLGVARALLGAVLAHAERGGCEVIVSHVPAQSRDANRFFARLGFSSVLVRRVVSTGALRRRISPSSAPGAEQVMRRRRSLRSRAADGGGVSPHTA